MATNEILDAGDPKLYWTQIPNIVFDLGLTPYEITLYCHLKRAAGSKVSGKCTKSTATLVRETHMGAGTVSRAKTALEKKRPELSKKPLIRIQEKPNPRGGKAFQEITITDIWKENMARFATSTEEIESADQVPVEVDPSSRPISTGEIKKNSKEEHTKKNIGSEFWNELRKDPLYSHVDFDREIARMLRWLARPENSARRMTPKFVYRWLDKIEVTVIPPVASPNGHDEAFHARQAQIAKELGREYRPDAT